MFHVKHSLRASFIIFYHIFPENKVENRQRIKIIIANKKRRTPLACGFSSSFALGKRIHLSCTFLTTGAFRRLRRRSVRTWRVAIFRGLKKQVLPVKSSTIGCRHCRLCATVWFSKNLTSACHPELVEVLRRRSKTEERSSEGIYFTFLLIFVG